MTRSKRYDTISNVAEMPRLTSVRSEKIRLDKRQNCDIIISLLIKCGSSSVVEHNLAKVGVAGSSPVFRSTFLCLTNVSSVSPNGGIGRRASFRD